MTLPVGREITYKIKLDSWFREKNQYTDWQWSEWKQDVKYVPTLDFTEEK